MTTVSFIASPYGDYKVRFNFNQAIVNLIKGKVPSFARTWDKATRTWTVDAAFAPLLAEYLRNAGCIIVGMDTNGNGQTSRRREVSSDVGSAFKTVLEAAGPDRVDALYRSMSRVLHPDTASGDAELQRKLNAARDELR